MRRSGLFFTLAVAFGGTALWAAYLVETRPPPEIRGARLAVELGCIGCHDLRGGFGTPNPGAPEQQVPGWGGGNALMYVRSEGEFEEWVLDGLPERLRGSEWYRTKRQKMVLSMPAYRGRLSRRELLDLKHYFAAVAGLAAPESGAPLRGYEVAESKGCFGCHGPAGLGGVDNPGSFAGYIPGWRGRGFNALVKDRDELREWILDGTSRRIAGHPVAGFFLRRQQLQMPAYRAHLEDGELEALIAYIESLSASPAGEGKRE